MANSSSFFSACFFARRALSSAAGGPLKEMEEGKLAMPKGPRTLYVLSGSGYDSAKGEVTNGELRWVVYVPYATPESTGLSTTAGPGPWLMYPGTPGAHIMFSSQKK